MKYSGGKSRIARRIAESIAPFQAVAGATFEPFCGALNVTVHLQPDVASDFSRGNINLFNLIREGWVPPEEVTEEVYRAARAFPGINLHDFCAHGCSWGGKFWGGYARGGDRNFTQEAFRSLKKKLDACDNVELSHGSYVDLQVREGDLIYCDPPYAGTVQAYETNTFDSEAFWRWCRECAEAGALVFVSEYVAPPDALLFREFDTYTSLSKSGEGRRPRVSEKLFVMTPGSDITKLAGWVSAVKRGGEVPQRPWA